MGESESAKSGAVRCPTHVFSRLSRPRLARGFALSVTVVVGSDVPELRLGTNARSTRGRPPPEGVSAGARKKGVAPPARLAFLAVCCEGLLDARPLQTCLIYPI